MGDKLCQLWRNMTSWHSWYSSDLWLVNFREAVYQCAAETNLCIVPNNMRSTAWGSSLWNFVDHCFCWLEMSKSLGRCMPINYPQKVTWVPVAYHIYNRLYIYILHIHIHIYCILVYKDIYHIYTNKNIATILLISYSHVMYPTTLIQTSNQP